MKLRYFVGVPEDAFRKHDVVFTSADAADTHAMRQGINNRGRKIPDMLFVYEAKTLLHKASELALVLDMNDLCARFTKTYNMDRPPSDSEPKIHTYFEEFADRLLRFRRMAQKLKEAA